MKNSNKKKRVFLLEPIFEILARCSLRCLFRLAKLLSFFIAHANNRIAKQTKQNLALCFADKTLQQQKQLYHLSIVHNSCSLMEMAALWHQSMDRVLSTISSINAHEFIGDRRAKIIIAPHFGSWELLNLWLAQQDILFSLYKPAKSEQLNDYILRKRSRNGAQLVAAETAGLRTLLKGLKAGGSVMILPDQKPNKKSAKIVSTFYGQDATTSLLIKNLMKKVDCSVYIAAAVRDIESAHYSINIKSLSEKDMLASDQESANYLNQSIEQFIADDEAQYQWSYRRFTQEAYDSLNEARIG